MDIDVQAGVVSDAPMNTKDRINAAFNMASPAFFNSAINRCLKEGHCIAQSTFVEKLLQLLTKEDIQQFLKEIDTVDM